MRATNAWGDPIEEEGEAAGAAEVNAWGDPIEDGQAAAAGAEAAATGSARLPRVALGVPSGALPAVNAWGDPIETKEAPPAPPDSGFFPSAAAAAAESTLYTSAAVADAASEFRPWTGKAALPEKQAEMDALKARLETLKQAKPPLNAGYFGGGEWYAKRQADLEATAREMERLQRGPASETLAGKLRAAAGHSYEYYEADPRSTNAAAQIGRGSGKLTAMAPAMLAPVLGLPAMAAQGAGEAYEATYAEKERQLREAGETSEDKIAEAAGADASLAAVKTAPALAAYMAGGKLTSMAVAKLLGAATRPLVKGLVGGAAATAANVAVGSGMRALEGHEAMPTLENLTMDAGFGALHGYGEYRKADADVGQEYLRARVEREIAALEAQRREGAEAARPSAPEAEPEAVRLEWEEYERGMEARLPNSEYWTDEQLDVADGPGEEASFRDARNAEEQAARRTAAGKREGDSLGEVRQAEADGWWQGLFRTIAPGLGRQLQLLVRDPAELARAGLVQPEQLAGDEQAAFIRASGARRAAIYLLGKLGRAVDGNAVLDIAHESGHAWWDTLRPEVQSAYGRLWEQEMRTGRGLFAGDTAKMDPRIGSDVQEWFAEKMAHEQMEWAAKRLRAGAHDGSLAGQAAAKMRTLFLRAHEVVSGEPLEISQERFRRFLNKGDAMYADGGRWGVLPTRHLDDTRRRFVAPDALGELRGVFYSKRPARRQENAVVPGAGDHWVRPKGWRLPKNGKWDGTPGNSNFYPSNPRKLGLKPGDKIPFRQGYVDFSQWSLGNFTARDNLTGYHEIDRPIMLRTIAEKRGLTVTQVKSWLAAKGAVLHHSGGNGFQLIPKRLHGDRSAIPPSKGVSHQGHAYDLRNGKDKHSNTQANRTRN